MADESMDDILEQARRLGDLIRQHPRYQRLREADARVRDDAGATGALDGYNKAAVAIQQKEVRGRPVEVEEKRNLDRLRDAVASNETVKAFSTAQADYAEMMQRMNEAIFRAVAGADADLDEDDEDAFGPDDGPDLVMPE